MTNKEIKRIQSLEQGKFRRKYGQFLIEGKRLVQSALERKVEFDLIYFTEPFQRENTEWIQSIESSDVSYENISAKQLEKISFTKSPISGSSLAADILATLGLFLFASK